MSLVMSTEVLGGAFCLKVNMNIYMGDNSDQADWDPLGSHYVL